MDGSETADLNWLFLDLNSYFASVEQHLEPTLRGCPIAVVPVMTDSTCAIAASYEAKAFGVTTGTPVFEARRLCPGLRLVPARHEVYVDFHHRIIAEVDRHVPVESVCSIDEMACRLTGPARRPEAAAALARRIKRGLAENLGPAIRCSIGIAPNRYLAKVATELEKPDGLVLLPRDSLPGPLLRLGLRDFPGIGANIERRLLRAGITDAAALWRAEAHGLRMVWGGVAGLRFWYALHGTELPDRETRRRSIGHSHVLAPELRSPERARLVARRLVAKAAARLRRLDHRAGALDLAVRLESRSGLVSSAGMRASARIEAACDTFTLLAALEELWRRMEEASAGARIRKIAVTLRQLSPSADAQADLFAAAPETPRTRARIALSQAMDAINGRFGQNTVALGALPDPDTAFTGAKVAFTRIPDRAEFKE